MKFSIIIPSFNQDKYIADTFNNLKQLKEEAAKANITIELLLFDNCSNEIVQNVIAKYQSIFYYIEIKKDKGQYDAINNGIKKATGDYWTWLNTDDLIDIEGFLKITSKLETDKSIDYIYGGIKFINSNGDFISEVKAELLVLKNLVNVSPSIFQPGSFFKKEFTDKIGLLDNYNCCFDYEYILRVLFNKGKIECCDFPVSSFRLHNDSKTGSIIPIFIKEQLEISKKYGRRLLSIHTLIASLRLIKHKIFKGK